MQSQRSKNNIGLHGLKIINLEMSITPDLNTGGMGSITHPFCSYKKNDVYALNIEIEKFLSKP